MLKEIRSEDEIQKLLPEEHLPYSCNVLTKPLIEYAVEHLNETDETKKRSLAAVREFIKSQLGAHEDFEDILLLCFLRTKKIDIERTCGLIKSCSDFVRSYRSLMTRVDAQAVQRAIESKTIGFLPYRDAKGRAIVFLRTKCWNPDEIKAHDLIFGSAVALHVSCENPVNQVAGYVVIMDCKHTSLKQLTAISSWLIFGIQALQKLLPVIVKEIHITHAPAVVRTCWKAVKPIISDKIHKRITFYKSTHWTSLHRRIPPAILPEELGGELGPYSYDHWATDLPGMERRYFQRLRMLIDRRKSH